MSPEVWIRIPDYPDYEVSSLGRIKSYKVHRGQPGPRYLRPGADNKGYYTVRIGNDLGMRTWKLHTLVARAFLGKRPEGAEIRHLDGDNQNNRVGNLVYGTPAENLDDKIRHNTHRKHGHPFDGVNSYVRAGRPRARACRRCLAISDAKRRKPRAAA